MPRPPAIGTDDPNQVRSTRATESKSQRIERAFNIAPCLLAFQHPNMALERIAQHSANTNVTFRPVWNGKSRRIKPSQPLLQRNGDRIR
jgi:hypothetical protein